VFASVVALAVEGMGNAQQIAVPRDLRQIDGVRGEIVGFVAAQLQRLASELPDESAKGDRRKMFAEQTPLALERAAATRGWRKRPWPPGPGVSPKVSMSQ